MKNIYKLTTASLIGLLLMIQLPYTSYGQAVLYNSLTQSFTYNVSSSSSQCTDFENWRATLTRTDYSVINIRSNTSSYVATCTNPTIVQAMATFLRTISTPSSFTTQTWTDGSNTWMIGTCNGIEVMQNNSSICNCTSTTNNAVFRSCIINPNWGGVGGATCSAASQTLTIEFGYPNTQSLNFDGVNDYCTTASTTNLNLIDSFTIETWIKPTTFTASAGIISKYQNSSNRGFTLRTGGVSPYTSIDFMGLSTATGVLSANTWYHVAVVANNSQGNPKIYINGVLTSTTGTYLQPVTNTDSVTIGCEYRTSPRYFNGNIDEVRIWKRIVTQQELAYHMGCAAVPTTATNLTAYYRFDQGTVNGTNTSITTLLDSSGNGSHMALRNFALTGTSSNFVVGNVGGSCPSYLPSPVISSFSPISGSVGSSVTLTGYNFSAIPANNTVYFGGVKATVTAASTISLTVTVPTGATYSPITVYVNNLMDQSIIPFNVIFPSGAGISSSSFQTKVDFAAGTNPVGSALADLDGDGKMDIVVTNGSSNTISVYRNISVAGSITSGSFAAKVDFATGTVPNIIVVGDLDGDGKLDLAVSNNSASTISIFRNTSTSGSITTSSFAAKVDFSVGSNPRGIALNDIDGDGKLDIAVANKTGNTVSVLYNTSTSGSITSGSFAAQITFSSSSPNEIVFSDLDGDGKAEMLVANGASNITSVYLNTASRGSITSSSFATAATYTTGSFAEGAATGDIDGDGKQDMVIVNSSSNTVSLFRNTSTLGSLGFAAKVDFTTGTTPSSVKLGDIDGDNKVDLIIPNNSSSTISVFRNTATSGTISSGSLAAKVDFSVGSYPALVSVGDIDGDGRMDMVSPNNGSATVSVIKYNGTASITTQPQSANMCIGGASSFTVVGAGSGTLTYQWYKNGSSISGATSATFSISSCVIGDTGSYYVQVRDSLLCTASSNAVTLSNFCLVTINSFTPTSAAVGASVVITGINFSATAANNTVYFGGVKATVTAASTTSLTVTVPVGASYAPITVYVNNLMDQSARPFNVIFAGGAGISSSTYQAKVDFSSGTSPYYTMLADIDGDGKLDMIAANQSSSTISLYRNTSTSGSVTSTSFGTKVDFTTGSNPRNIAIGDLDGDGKLDIAVTNVSSSSISVFRNTSTSGSITTGSLAAKVDFTVGTTPVGIAFGDLDGDGKLDIATGNVSTSNISVLYNTSSSGSITTSSFASHVTFATGSSPYCISIADLDGDGKAEIASANYGANTISVLLNTTTRGNISTSSFAAGVAYTAGSNPSGITTGDIDGDGKQDIIVSNVGASSVSLLRNTSTTGSLGFATKVDFTVGSSPYYVSVGDLDGDNKIDIVSPNYGSSTVSLLRNTATSGTITSSSLATKVDYTVTSGAMGTAIGDIDGDGRMDLAVPNGGSVTVSIFKYNGSAAISTQPQNALICIGGAASFSVVATGSGPLTYQWYKNGSSISGATSATFSISSCVIGDTGSYYVQVRDSLLSLASSNTVTLSSNSLTTISTQPANATTCAGTSASFTVAATGTGTLVYQWKKNGTNISGATASTYTISSPAVSDTGSFSVIVSGTSCPVTSNNATLTVNAVTTITTQPLGVSRCLGVSATFTVAGLGTGTLTYQWRKAGTSISGATSSSYTISSPAISDTGAYSVVVTGTCGSVTSNNANLNLNTPTSISTQPTSATICAGTSTSFTVAGLGTGTLTYQWRKAGTSISGATSSSYTISSPAISDTGAYSVIVTGTCGSVTSNNATLALIIPFVWTGNSGTNWNSTSNWSCPVIPLSTSNVSIPVTTNSPLVTDAQQANNIIIQTGATLTLNNSASQLSIYGTITNNGTFVNSNGKIVFAGSSVQTINGGTYSKVQISNSAGFSLGGNVILNDSLILISGKLNLGNYNLTLGNASFASAGNATSYVATTGTGFLISNGIGSTGKTGNQILPIGNYSFNPITFSNSGTTDNFTFGLIDSVTNTYSGSVPTGSKITTNAVNRTWVIKEALTGGSNSTVALQWSGSDELSGFSRSTSYEAYYNGTTWMATTGSAASGTNPYSQTRSGITNFNAFGVASNGTLPITLIDFSGVKKDRTVELNWITASELNNDHFIIERTTNHQNYELIGSVKGNGTTSEMHDYSLSDDITSLIQQKVNTIYYRLTQIDKNGRTTIAKEVSVLISQKLNGITFTAQPNPFVNNVSVLINSEVEENMTLQLIDITGRTISTQKLKVSIGDNNFELLNAEGLKDGMYFINLISQHNNIIQKVTKIF